MKTVATPIDDGGPAFPITDPHSAHATAMAASIHIEDPVERERAYILARAAAVIGMTLRDYFAGQELAKVDGTAICDIPEAYARTADHCYRMADAMLKARAAS